MKPSVLLRRASLRAGVEIDSRVTLAAGVLALEERGIRIAAERVGQPVRAQTRVDGDEGRLASRHGVAIDAGFHRRRGGPAAARGQEQNRKAKNVGSPHAEERSSPRRAHIPAPAGHSNSEISRIEIHDSLSRNVIFKKRSAMA
jgi:hypothetical protein